MNEEKQKPGWPLYRSGLFMIAGAFLLLLLYLVTFIVNPAIDQAFGEGGPLLLYRLQTGFLIASVIVFAAGLAALIGGLVTGENIRGSWLVVFFAAPTFFVMAAIVFTPLIQGITFSFTNADQKNISKIRPTVETRVIDGRPQRVRTTTIEPPSFEYVGLANYVEIVTGRSRSQRAVLSEQRARVEDLAAGLRPETLPEGAVRLELTDLLSHSPASFEAELESRFRRGGEWRGGVRSAENRSDAEGPLFVIELEPGTDWREFSREAFLPRVGLPRFYQVLTRTIVWTVANVFFHFAIGLGLALLLNQPIAFRTGFRILLLLPWGVPSVVSAFSWRWLFNGEFGLINFALQAFGGRPLDWLSDPTLMLIAAIVTNIWLGFPFMTVTMLGGLQTIPKELYESARVDGAGAFQQFGNITMPMLRPVAMTATLLGIIWTFNMFNVIYLVTQASVEADILVTYAYRAAFLEWNLGTSTAYSVVILSILLVFCTFYLRLLRGGQEVKA
jgi:arabinogalactan oligomer/maltooligosaccharide transport system permease protein